MEARLLAQGAREDAFTSAFLGDVPRLEQQLISRPDWAQVGDPATDIVEIIPLHHAVAGGRPVAVRTMLSHDPGPIRGSQRAFSRAADHGSLDGDHAVGTPRPVELARTQWFSGPRTEAPARASSGAIRSMAPYFIRAPTKSGSSIRPWFPVQEGLGPGRWVLS